MIKFVQQLDSLSRRSGEGRTPRQWVYVPYDQLTDEIGPLAEIEGAGILLVESVAKARRRPYHKRKLALVLANMRQFALEQARRGVAVDYRFTRGGYADELAKVANERGRLVLMCPAERELRDELAPLVRDGLLEFHGHAGWLTDAEDFANSQSGPPWRMDAFYRHVRRTSGILMRDGKPEGGKFSFDVDNRRRWAGDPPAPELPTFAEDDITREVIDLVERDFADHPGRIVQGSLPATREDAERLWEWARRECLASFGPYQDAMSGQSASLFHTRISGLLHLHRLLPQRVVDDVLAMRLPIASKEGFVRQILGWREFVRHVHEATGGMSTLPANVLGAHVALPPVFWAAAGPDARAEAARSGLDCLDGVLADVWEQGYGHHITRLMVLANLATLLDVDPRELCDWFWVAYDDAYDWVVEPNVLGMGTFSVGEVMTTKPYVSGAAYIDRMSDYCRSCAFNPRTNCPVTPMYWAFLDRHADTFEALPRMRLPLASLRKRSSEVRGRDRAIVEQLRDMLSAGRAVTPADLPARGTNRS